MEYSASDIQVLEGFEVVRKRPGMYVGGVGEDGVLHLVLEVVANAYDQYLASRCTRIALTIAADGTVVVEDDGPGLPVDGDGALPPLERLLTTWSRRPTVDGHRPHVHLGLGGCGLFVVDALAERLEVITVRAGTEARVVCSRGKVIEGVTTCATSRPSGTTVRFRPDPQVFPQPHVPRAALTRVLEDLSFLTPGLTLTWRVEGDALTAAGLAGRVALRLPCAVADVAHRRAELELAGAPIDVEVALAWRLGPHPSDDEADIESFVNLGRTTTGLHVRGLRAGVRASFPDRREAARGLVAAVAVTLADVKFGSPVRDHLITPGVDAPVAEVTRAALAAWRERHGDRLPGA